MNEKLNTETQILENMRDQITSDKACRYLSKLLYDLKVKNRAMVSKAYNMLMQDMMLFGDRKLHWEILKIAMRQF